jgi:hypothetical protein
MYVPILIQELEQLSCRVLIQSVRELGKCRRDFQALVEDHLLALETNIGGPFHEAG